MYKIYLYSILICASLIKYSYAYLPIVTDSRIKTLVYSPTEIFSLKFHYNYQSYIEFPRDEKFKIVSLGDSSAWNIKQVDNRLFIKPKQAGVITNMTIITSKRSYHLEIESSNKSFKDIDNNLSFVVRFYYPDTAYDFLQSVKIKRPLKSYSVKPSEEIIKNVNISPVITTSDKGNSLNKGGNRVSESNELRNKSNISDDLYNYSYSMVGGDGVSFVPSKVYDDGQKTYFKFPKSTFPDIYFVDTLGKEYQAKYIVKDGLVIVDNIFKQFVLRGNGKLLCIFNDTNTNPIK